FFVRSGLAQLSAARRQQIGGLAQNLPAVVAGELRDYFCAALRKSQRFFQISGVGFWHRIDDRVIERIFDLKLFWFIHPVSGQKNFHFSKPPEYFIASWLFISILSP